MYDPTMTPPRTFEQLLAYVLTFGFFAAIGAAGLLLILLVLVWPQWSVNAMYVEVDGLVVDQRVVSGE